MFAGVFQALLEYADGQSGSNAKFVSLSGLSFFLPAHFLVFVCMKAWSALGAVPVEHIGLSCFRH